MELEVERPDGAVKEDAEEGDDGEEQEDGDGPGSSRGDCEGVGVDSESYGEGSQDTTDDGSHPTIDVYEQGLPLENSDESNDGGDHEGDGKGDVNASPKLLPTIPAPALLSTLLLRFKDVEDEGNSLARLHSSGIVDEEDTEGGKGGDADNHDEQGNGDGALLQGQAEEPLGVVEEEAKLIPTTFRHRVRRFSSRASQEGLVDG